MDTFSKSDPEVDVFIRDQKNKSYQFIGKTETIFNNLNPEFTKNFTLDYFFEREQFLLFKVYDSEETGERELIGDCETTISRIMGSKRQTFEGPLLLPDSRNKKTRGFIIIKADSIA